MTKNEDLFSGRSFDPEKLKAFGFTEREDFFTYSRPLGVIGFEARIRISKKTGKVFADVFDTETEEIYVLAKVPEATGAFVGKIRDDFERLLQDAARKCSVPETFRSDTVRRLIRHIGNEYGDEPEFLWERFPRNAVFRRKDNKKWYTVLLTANGSKIGLPSDEDVEIVNLKLPPEKIAGLIDGKRFFAGYHMNKTHWITILADGSVPFETVRSLLSESRSAAAKKTTR